MSQMTHLQTERSCQPYLCQLKTCTLLGKAVHGLSAAGSTPGYITDQQYDFGQDLFLSSLFSLPFYLFNQVCFFFGHQLSVFASFFYAITAALTLVELYAAINNRHIFLEFKIALQLEEMFCLTGRGWMQDK